MKSVLVAATNFTFKRRVITQDDLVAGNMNLGYMGIVPTVITPQDLAALCGITVGTLLNNSTPWLGFTLNGKGLFIPQKPIRNYISWNQLNALGLIEGKIVVIDGVRYKVRVFTPRSGTNEWENLMYKVAATGTHTWANYSDATLVLSGNLAGQNSFTQETSGSNNYIGRGSQGATYVDTLDKASGTQFRGWRPVLELVD